MFFVRIECPLHVQNCSGTYDLSTRLTTTVQLHNYFSKGKKNIYMTFHIHLYHLFYQQSVFKHSSYFFIRNSNVNCIREHSSQFKINYLYLGAKIFQVHLLVVNHYHFEKNDDVIISSL